MSRFYSPLRYPGGKNGIFNFVASLFYENNLLGMHYAEPYAGGAGLALRLLFEEYVDCIFINDYDISIYAFWKVITEDSEAFCEWINDIDININNWYKYKNIHTNKEQYSLFEIAKATFFLNRTNVSGVLKGGVIGGYKQQGKYKISARFNKSDLINRIDKINSFSHRIQVSNLDGIEFVKKMGKKKNDTFIYLDPPYYQKGAELYMNFFKNQDHLRLSKHIHKLAKHWMVSYDNHEFILNLYPQQNKLIYQFAQSASNRIGDEVLIFSNYLSFSNSKEKLKSPILI